LVHEISVFWNTLKIACHFSSIASGTFLELEPQPTFWFRITLFSSVRSSNRSSVFMESFKIALITCALSWKSDQVISVFKFIHRNLLTLSKLFLHNS
jgi:hypothetical protein